MSESVSVVRDGCVTYVCKDIFNWSSSTNDHRIQCMCALKMIQYSTKYWYIKVWTEAISASVRVM